MNWAKKHKILTVVGVILVLAIIGAAVGGGDNKSTNNTPSNAKPESTKKAEGKPTLTKIGETSRDGKFEFVVKGMKCGAASVGDNQYLTKTAQGKFCLLDVTVKNIGNEKQSLLSSDQKLFDSANKEYSADDTATLYATPNGSSWYNDINPGNSVEGKIVFDVPKDVKPNVAELHDSSLSGGVKVSLQ